MSKKQALTEFHRGSILAAAERLFAEKANRLFHVAIIDVNDQGLM